MADENFSFLECTRPFFSRLATPALRNMHIPIGYLIDLYHADMLDAVSPARLAACVQTLLIEPMHSWRSPADIAPVQRMRWQELTRLFPIISRVRDMKNIADESEEGLLLGFEIKLNIPRSNAHQHEDQKLFKSFTTVLHAYRERAYAPNDENLPDYNLPYDVFEAITLGQRYLENLDYCQAAFPKAVLLRADIMHEYTSYFTFLADALLPTPHP